jgi:nucleotide-binding universal stress UspA family protein
MPYNQQYRRILVPLDGSALAEAVIPHAERMAAALGSEVVLLRVLPATGVVPDVAREDIAQATMYLKGIEKRLADQGRKVIVQFAMATQRRRSWTMPGSTR